LHRNFYKVMPTKLFRYISRYFISEHQKSTNQEKILVKGDMCLNEWKVIFHILIELEARNINATKIDYVLYKVDCSRLLL
jgi:hypothetical protein